MDDIRDLLESKELKAVVEAIERFEKLVSHPALLKEGEFQKIAGGKKLGGDRIIQILVADPAYDSGVREILGAGLAAWIIDPQYDKPWHGAMCRAAMRHMNGAEDRVGLKTEFWTLEHDIVARYAFTGTEFLREIYDGLGRYQAFLEANPKDTVRFMAEELQPVINTIVRTIQYMHFAADNFTDDARYHKPSLNRAVQIFAGLKEHLPNFSTTFVSRSVLHAHWSASKDTLALVYAADSIHIGRTTLLQLIIDERFSVAMHGSYLNRWFGRAAHVGSHIFATAADTELKKITRKMLHGIEPAPFHPKEFGGKEYQLVHSHYKKRENKFRSFNL